MSHPAKNRFPISTFPYLNTIWRTNSYNIILPNLCRLPLEKSQLELVRRGDPLFPNFSSHIRHGDPLFPNFSSHLSRCNPNAAAQLQLGTVQPKHGAVQLDLGLPKKADNAAQMEKREEKLEKRCHTCFLACIIGFVILLLIFVAINAKFQTPSWLTSPLKTFPE